TNRWERFADRDGPRSSWRWLVRRYLIVANRTLTGPHLVAEAETRCALGPCEFHVVVPQHRSGEGIVWTEGHAHAHARAHLEHALEHLRDAGLDVTGEIGDESPLLAVGDVLRRQAFDEVIVSTLPPGASRWLKLDLPNRLRHAYAIPVTHVVATTEVAR
ncbi:MAG TPA: hypothetical protein VEZ15_08135, partial [Acidimicrobiia bacterium]|nr:hypothetical protein [Acidimicrobiia bacterium]